MEGINIEAEVIHGRKIGRALGFPTANMSLEGYESVERGVYRSEVNIDGVLYGAPAHGKPPQRKPCSIQGAWLFP